MKKAQQLLMEARVYVMRHAVYFTDTLLGLIPHPEPRVGTMGVTPGMVLYYNEDFVEGLTVEEVAAVLWHECNHVLRFSWDRNLGGDPDRRNIADDLAINSSGRLQKDGGSPVWKFPKCGVFPENYGLPAGLTAEEYYLRLPTGAKPQGICGGSCGRNGPLEAEIDAKVGGRTPIEIEGVRQQTAHRIRSHGLVPGDWSDWANVQLTPSVVAWESVFSNIVRSTLADIQDGDEELSMAHPSRRSLIFADEPMRPGPVGGVVEFVVILDTSASMDMEMIVRCLVEAQHAIVASGAEYAWFLQADSRTQGKAQRIRSRDLSKVEVKGRGGTNFAPAIEEIQTLRPRPAVAVYFTDGEGKAPDRPPPRIKFVWGLIGRRGQQAEAPASWGRVVHIQ